MTINELFIPMDDGAEIFVREWTDAPKPWAVLQLAHGMAEHSLRYQEFASNLNKAGIIVVANDHRGHGRTGEKAGVMGYFAKENGFDRVVKDLHALNRRLKNKFPELPIFLLGHSMGSFLTRRYIQLYGETIQGAVLMGSGGDPGPAAKLGRLIARWQMRKDPTKPSKLLDSLSFGSFNKGIPDAVTRFDWLTRDPKIIEDYMADPFCGIVCSSGFFFDLFDGLAKIHDPKLITAIPKELPLLVVSGQNDPVGKNGKGVKEFVAQYRKLGLQNIETILYPGARHELLNETNKDEVIDTIKDWLQKQIS